MLVQGNFAPVDPIGEAVTISSMEGEIPNDFLEGVSIRNGFPNPLFREMTAIESDYGKASSLCVEGDRMVHVLSSQSKRFTCYDINVSSIDPKGEWDVNGALDLPKDPQPGELVVLGIEWKGPIACIRMISGTCYTKLLDKIKLNLVKSILAHEICHHQKHLLHCRLTKFDRHQTARIGRMPRYGDEIAITWFDVEPHCLFTS
ncbi:hypothetical protein AMTRI_Chr05g67110 [Amborella trichopoda]